jgi:hypothetical protein
LLFLPSPVRSSPLFLFEETRGSPCPLLFFFLLSLLSSRFFLVLSSLRMPCGPVLSVFNAGVKAAVFFFFGWRRWTVLRLCFVLVLDVLKVL